MEEHFPLFPHVDYDMVVCEDQWPVGVSAKYASEYIRRVAGGAVSYTAQLSSVDYTLKRYLKDTTYPELKHDRLDFRISRCVENYVNSIKDRFSAFGKREGSPIGTIMCDLTLVRLKAAFGSLLTLANRGLLFEATAVSRMTIEQIAWASRCFAVEDEELVIKTSAPKSITWLKRIYPTIGPFYGWLSDHSHWHYQAHVKGMDLNHEFVGYILSSSRFKASALAATLIAVDCYVACFERLYENRISEFEVLAQTGGKFLFREDRETRELFDEVVSIVGPDDMTYELKKFLASGQIV